jgi:hypothetical protein
MGRKQTIKTVMQLDKQKAKWRKTSNRKRKELYHTDPLYHDKVATASRLRAKQTRGGDQVDRVAVCERSLALLQKSAVLRKIVDTDRVIPTFTSTELAPLLGLSSVVVLHGWQRDNRFPKPELAAIVGRTHANVYTVPQAKKLITIMKKHFAEKNYLNSKDDETIGLLAAAMF